MSAPENKTNAQIDPRTKTALYKKGYKVKSLLSESGSYSNVYKGTRLRKAPDGSSYRQNVAVKIMDLEQVGKTFKQMFLPREIAILMTTKHRHIVTVYDIFKSYNRIYIFMELAPKGSLADFLKTNGILTEPHACKWFKQAAEALDFLHNKVRVAHRDIKLDNLLLDQNSNIKVADFGFAKEVFNEDTNLVELSKTMCGSEPYFSPQIVNKKPYDARAADIWAFGVVIFAMLNNKFLYHFHDKKQMYKEQTNENYLDERYIKSFSSEYKQLQKGMQIVDEQARWKIEDCLSSEWVKKGGKV